MQNHFRNFHQIFTFWDPLSKKIVFTKESICLASVDTITLNRIIGLNLNLAHMMKAWKEGRFRQVALCLPMVVALFMKKIFVKIKASFIVTKYTKKWVLWYSLNSPRHLDRTNFSEDSIYFLCRSLKLQEKKKRMS